LKRGSVIYDNAGAVHDDTDSWKTLRRFLPYLWAPRDHALKRRIIGALLLVFAAKAISLALPFAYKQAVDVLATPDGDSFTVAIGLVIAYGFGRFGAVAFDQMRNIAFERVGHEAALDLANDVFSQLHRLSLRFHLERRIGELSKVMDRGLKSINIVLYFLVFNILPTIIELIAVAVIFYMTFGWELVFAVGVSIALYVFVTRSITEWRTRLHAKMNSLDERALGKAVDSLLNYETVKYFGAEEHERERYIGAAKAYAEAAIKSENSLGWLAIAQALITNTLLASAMVWTVWGWDRGRLSVGDLALVNTYLMQLFRPLDMIGVVYRMLRQGIVDMAAMFRLLDCVEEVKDLPGAPTLMVQRPIITFDDVVFGYNKGCTILHGLSFEVPAGQSVAIVGPSGAGKSTVARLLFRFYDPWSGRILVDGQDISQVSQASVRRHIGFVPQDCGLFNDTIAYNIAYGRSGVAFDSMAKAARDAAIMPLIEKSPDGFATQVGERGLQLSSGERQRLAIARTLVKDPPILLLDEATSALDTRTEQEILATLRRLTADRTSIMIAHRLSSIANVDRILVLDGGVFVESGTHNELLRKGGLYEDMWMRQSADEREPATYE
jgi:ABC-type transport system involved in Fe-S cluster assembly fused permease/ATPase subunit